jgi:hypothetical protein
MGTWLVDIDPNHLDAPTKFSRVAKQLTSDESFDPKVCADSLAHGLQREAATIESWALKQIRPGFVVEELYANHIDRSLPPDEFCLFVIWGRVYVGQWNSVETADRYLNGFIYRDGSPAKGCDWKDPMPDWVPWMEMVTIAESLSTGKDLFRYVHTLHCSFFEFSIPCWSASFMCLFTALPVIKTKSRFSGGCA